MLADSYVKRDKKGDSAKATKWYKLATGESAYPSFGLPTAEAKRAEMQGDPIDMEKLGNIYQRIRDHEKSVEYYDKAAHIYLL